MGCKTRKGHLPGTVAVWGPHGSAVTQRAGGHGWYHADCCLSGCSRSPPARGSRVLLCVWTGGLEAEPGGGVHEADCISLTSLSPQAGCDSPRERLLGKCHREAVVPPMPPHPAAYLTFLGVFLLEGEIGALLGPGDLRNVAAMGTGPSRPRVSPGGCCHLADRGAPGECCWGTGWPLSRPRAGHWNGQGTT